MDETSVAPGTDLLAREVRRALVPRLLRAGVLTGLVDGLFAVVLTVFDQASVTRLFQGIASTVLGRDAFDGGVATVALGVAMHFGVAFGWSAVFLFLVLGSAHLRAFLGSRHGVIKVASVYGPMIWVVMSLAVIPLLTERPPVVGLRWWIQLFGHFPFVGVPIVASIVRGVARPKNDLTGPQRGQWRSATERQRE